jgi:hypothetical protein
MERQRQAVLTTPVAHNGASKDTALLVLVRGMTVQKKAINRYQIDPLSYSYPLHRPSLLNPSLPRVINRFYRFPRSSSSHFAHAIPIDQSATSLGKFDGANPFIE